MCVCEREREREVDREMEWGRREKWEALGNDHFHGNLDWQSDIYPTLGLDRQPAVFDFEAVLLFINLLFWRHIHSPLVPTGCVEWVWVCVCWKEWESVWLCVSVIKTQTLKQDKPMMSGVCMCVCVWEERECVKEKKIKPETEWWVCGCARVWWGQSRTLEARHIILSLRRPS